MHQIKTAIIAVAVVCSALNKWKSQKRKELLDDLFQREIQVRFKAIQRVLRVYSIQNSRGLLQEITFESSLKVDIVRPSYQDLCQDETLAFLVCLIDHLQEKCRRSGLGFENKLPLPDLAPIFATQAQSA